MEELGQGSFGMVYKGEVYDLNGKPFVPCAAKVCLIYIYTQINIHFDMRLNCL